MKTKIIKLNPKKPNKIKIKYAAEVIKSGGLVAFPTETVYGLGANVFSLQAIRKIFVVKRRPLKDPLIVHISNKKDLYKLTASIPKIANKLIEKFWPGPLTLVFKKSELVPDIVTASLDTVAIRMPANKIALMLIKESNVPIAAPSANTFGYVSTTKAQHVTDDLHNKIDVVLDGGGTLVGVESTVLDLTTRLPTVLRPGGIAMEQLKKVIGGQITNIPEKQARVGVRSPGMLERHYSPQAKLILVEGDNRRQVSKIHKLINRFDCEGKKIGILTKKENKNEFNGHNIETISAKNFFSALRNFDKQKVDVIISQTLPKKKLGHAIMDRLYKAANSILLFLLILVLSVCAKENKNVNEVNEMNIIKLPQPVYKSSCSVEEAIYERKSVRKYKNVPLTIEEVSQLLWSAGGLTIDSITGATRAYPSAGGTYPLEIYLVAGNVKNLDSGIYHYEYRTHQIKLLRTGDYRKKLTDAALGQKMILKAPVSIIFTAIYSKTTGRYGERGRVRYVCMDLGHAAQNVYLQAEALGLGTVAIGAFYDEKVLKVLDIENEIPLYIMPIGKK